MIRKLRRRRQSLKRVDGFGQVELRQIDKLDWFLVFRVRLEEIGVSAE